MNYITDTRETSFIFSLFIHSFTYYCVSKRFKVVHNYVKFKNKIKLKQKKKNKKKSGSYNDLFIQP